MKIPHWKNSIFIAVAFLLVFKIILVTIQNINLRKDRLDLLSKIIKVNKKNMFLEESIESIYKNRWNIKDENFISTNNFELNNLVKEGNRVFCFIRENICNSCNLRVLQDLSILGREIGDDNIILLKNRKMNEQLLDLSSYNFKIIEIDTLLLPIEKTMKSPFIFILDEKFNIRIPYTSEWYPELYDNYFKKILSTQFNHQAKN
jgi:hypothetical protein